MLCSCALVVKEMRRLGMRGNERIVKAAVNCGLLVMIRLLNWVFSFLFYSRNG